MSIIEIIILVVSILVLGFLSLYCYARYRINKLKHDIKDKVIEKAKEVLQYKKVIPAKERPLPRNITTEEITDAMEEFNDSLGEKLRFEVAEPIFKLADISSTRERELTSESIKDRNYKESSETMSGGPSDRGRPPRRSGGSTSRPRGYSSFSDTSSGSSDSSDYSSGSCSSSSSHSSSSSDSGGGGCD